MAPLLVGAPSAVRVGMSVTGAPRPSPPTPPTPPPAVSWPVVVGICPDSAAVAPFCEAASLTSTWRCTFCVLRPAVMVTRPPVVPVGVKTLVLPDVGETVPMLPLSTPHAALPGCPL